MPMTLNKSSLAFVVELRPSFQAQFRLVPTQLPVTCVPDQVFMTSVQVSDGEVWGRPTGDVVAKDGAPWASEDGSGTLRCISGNGKNRRTDMKIAFLMIPLALTLGASAASAEKLNFKAQLLGSSEVPATSSAGKGAAEVTVDTSKMEISWTINYSGLSGTATAAHFHGPAGLGESAAPEIDISNKIKKGIAPITAAQLADLQAGKIYVNIHTAKFPDGEIRGQVEK